VGRKLRPGRHVVDSDEREVEMSALMILFNALLCVAAFAAIFGLSGWGLYRDA
jgi:hypothetical protein